MRDWPTSPQAQDWPLPPTIYLLVQAIFEKGHNNPVRWLLDLVREDAVARGLFDRAVVQSGGVHSITRDHARNLSDALMAGDSNSSGEVMLRLLQNDGQAADRVAAVARADCVVTDTWFSMGDVQIEERRNLLEPYRIDTALMARAKDDAIFMHCLPAHRDQEVTAEVIDGKHSIVFDQAENRLHTQKAILITLLGDNPNL